MNTDSERSLPLVIRVRYGPMAGGTLIAVAGVIGSLSGSGIALIGLLALALGFAVLAGFRPFLKVVDGEARYVSMVSDLISSPADVQEVLGNRGLRWFLNSRDLVKLERIYRNGSPSAE